MKTTNAENDGKADDGQIEILIDEHLIDAAEIAFLRGVRRGLARARKYTAPGSAIREKCDELIREATDDIESLVTRRLEEIPPWPSAAEWAEFARRRPLAFLIPGLALIALCALAGRYVGWW